MDKLLENLEVQLDEKIHKIQKELLTSEGYYVDLDAGNCITAWEKIVGSGQNLAAQLFIGPYWGKAGMLMDMAIYRCRIEWSQRLLKKPGNSPERIEKIKRRLQKDKESLKTAAEKVQDKIKQLREQGKTQAADYMARYAKAILSSNVPTGRS
jgi:hypothetical protein